MLLGSLTESEKSNSYNPISSGGQVENGIHNSNQHEQEHTNKPGSKGSSSG